MSTDPSAIAKSAVLAVFDRRDRPDEPLTAPEVADRIGCARRTAHKKLTQLTDEGELETKKVGARGRVWWRPREPSAQPSSHTGPRVDQRAHERALRELHVASRRLMRAERHAAVADTAVAAAQRILGLSRCGLWMYRPEDRELEPVAWTDPGVETYGEPPAFPLEGSLVGAAFREGQYRHYDDVRSADDLFDPETQVRSELILPLGDHGVLNASSPEIGAFDEVDVSLARILAATVQTALDRADRIDERRQRRRALERQRDELESLNRINRLIEETIGALVEAATREELEETVCERLAASDLYVDAWIVERESTQAGRTLRTRTTGTSIADQLVDPWVPGGPEPPAVSDALEHGRVQVVSDLSESPTSAGPLETASAELGAATCLVVPIAYADTVFGALLVHASDPDRVSDRELQAFETLGRVVGFVINATNNRQLLQGNTAVEIEVVVKDPEVWFIAAADSLDGTLAIEGLVPTGTGTLIEYVSVEGVAETDVLATVTDLPAVADARVLASDGEIWNLECRVRRDGAGLWAIAEYGASIRMVRAEPGRARIRSRFPASASPRDALAVVRGTLPGAELVAKRVVDVSDRSVTTTRQAIGERLTEKQLAVLRASLHAGYYDSPRGTTAQELAASLDIAPSTLHQHLQAAQRKVLEMVFDERPHP